MYNRKLLRFIKKNFDYQEYIQTNLSYKSTNSDEIRICCVFCNESEYKLYVNNSKKKYNCFKCEASTRNTDVFNFIAECENISVRDAIEKLILEFKSITPEELSLYEDSEGLISDPPSFHTIKSIDGMPEDAVPFTEQNTEASPYFAYLFNRGFNFQDIIDCGMYYVPKPISFVYKGDKKVGNIGNRVLWPVYGGNNNLVSWLARSIKSDLPKYVPKYINAPGTELSKTVWPFAPPLNKDIVLVEGIIDSFALRKAGYYSYATFGKKISEEQISLFKYWEVESITVFLDHNAKKEIIKAVEDLRLIFDNIYVVDVSHWPRDEKKEIKDSGSMLTFLDGISILQETLGNKINIKDDWRYYKWQLM